MPIRFNPLQFSGFSITGASGGGGGGDSFTIIQPDAGTSPTATSATDTLTLTSADGSVTVTGDSTTDTIDFSVAVNANLTGPITSVGNATSVASQTGTGSTFVMNTSPTLVTPNIGTATGSASLNVLKAGDTMTGPLVMPAGTVGATSINGGTAGTGIIFPTSATMAYASGGAEIWRTGANGITIGNTTVQSKALYIKPGASATGIQLENANNTRKFNIDVTSAGLTVFGQDGTNGMLAISNVATGGTGVNWWSMSGNGPANPPPYPQHFNCISGDGNITALSSIISLNGNNVNGSPWLVFSNANATVNTIAGYVTTGSSKNPMSFAGTVHKTQTAASEVSDYIVATQKAGTLTEGLRLTDQGQLKVIQASAGLSIKEGSNCKQGVATLVGGTVTVSNTSVTANSRIQLTGQDDNGGTPGWLRVSARTAATSFTITSSSGTDTSIVAYFITEPS